VKLLGAKMPGPSANADRLEGGTVIEGRFNVFANNFAIENVGFDFGKYVVDTYYGGADTHTANHPLGGTWDAFAFAQPATPIAAQTGFYARNVIGLCRDSLSVGHAFLMEGIDGGFVDNVVAIYGVHGVVFKSKNMRGGAVAGWMASTDNVIFKSDTYAAGGNISLATVECRTYAPNCAPWSTPSPAKYGVYLNPATASFDGPIQIGAVKVYGADRGVYISGDANFAITDVQFGSLLADGYTGAMTVALDFITCRAQRIQIGSMIANNAIAGVQWNASSLADNAQHQVSIGTCKLTNISGFAVRAQRRPTMPPSAFLGMLAQSAQDCQRKTGIPASITLAQARWNRPDRHARRLRSSRQSPSPWPRPRSNPNGARARRQQPVRHQGRQAAGPARPSASHRRAPGRPGAWPGRQVPRLLSWLESMVDHAQFLLKNPRYAACFKETTGAGWARALQAPATRPTRTTPRSCRTSCGRGTSPFYDQWSARTIRMTGSSS
jgi:hypothetical protein